MGVLCSNHGLVRTALPRGSRNEALLALGPETEDISQSGNCPEEIAKQLADYFEGRSVDFSIPFDLREGTPFQRRVWEATRLIPYGKTKTYLEIARQVRSPRSARAVGQALGKNPVPIVVPCHRVVASDGTLGGFGGGLDMKQRLLDMESGKKATRQKVPIKV